MKIGWNTTDYAVKISLLSDKLFVITLIHVYRYSGHTENKGVNWMNKIDLITALVEKNKMLAKDARKIVDLVFKGFANELKKGSRIEIRGFGSFSIREYGAYIGRNPKTGKTAAVKPKKLPFFKVGVELKKMVNG